jgi:hypothetical protein
LNIYDDWHKSRPADGEQRCREHGLVPSARHGRQNWKRWVVRWRDPEGNQHLRGFTRREDAESFLGIRELARVRAELTASESDGIDPAGWYVYLLWEVRQDHAPIYVGSSGNILGRLGAHLADGKKRARIGWVTLIRCTSEKAMLRREGELIRKYRPEWNQRIPAAQKSGRRMPLNGSDGPGSPVRTTGRTTQDDHLTPARRA